MTEKYGVATSPNWADALREVDAVVICTPAPLHVPIALQTLKQGRHTLIEKPLSHSLENVDELLRASRETEACSAVAYVFHVYPILNGARDFIRSGGIGGVRQVAMTSGQPFHRLRPAFAKTYYRDRRMGGGAIQDALTHSVNWVESVVGPTDSVLCDCAHQVLPDVEVEDTVHIAARNGPALVSYALNQFQSPKENSIQFNAAAGSVRVEFHHQRWGVLLERTPRGPGTRAPCRIRTPTSSRRLMPSSTRSKASPRASALSPRRPIRCASISPPSRPPSAAAAAFPARISMPDSVPASSPSRPVRLAMLGMIPGNGHPYSWSAIVNGFDPVAMASCPYPVIPRYLGAQPPGSVRLPDTQVTHLWTDDPAEARHVAAAALIPNVVERPEEVIGHVDGVMISTDDGFDHVRRARPFVEAGLPVFVDKPLASSVEDLRTFVQWQRNGARLLSSSGLRYAAEIDDCVARLPTVGKLRWVSGVTCKNWERYGIHLLEPLFRLVGPGFLSIRLESQPGLEIAHLRHRSGVEMTLPMIEDGGGSFGTIHVYGTTGHFAVRPSDTYNNFRSQVLAFINFVRTGQASYPFSDTVELMTLLIGGLKSRAEGSRRVELTEISALLSQ